MKYCIILFFVILSFSSCIFDGPNCPGDIKLPVTISPYKPYYNIGDTITISSKFHKLLYDQKTEKFYDASGYRFSPSVDLSALDSANIPYRGTQFAHYAELIVDDSLKFDLRSFSSSENSSYLVGEYSIDRDSMFFEIKFKLNRKANLWLAIESISSRNCSLQRNCMFNCRPGREILFNLSSPDNNIELMRKYRFIDPNYSVLSDSITKFYNRASYCFEVR